MADEILNMTEIIDSLNHTLISSISPLVTIFKVVGVALLVYVIFLIVKALFRWKTMNKIGKMAKNVEEINNKMDVLIEKITNLGKQEKKTTENKEKKSIFKKLFSKKRKEDKKEKNKENKENKD